MELLEILVDFKWLIGTGVACGMLVLGIIKYRDTNKRDEKQSLTSLIETHVEQYIQTVSSNIHSDIEENKSTVDQQLSKYKLEFVQKCATYDTQISHFDKELKETRDEQKEFNKELKKSVDTLVREIGDLKSTLNTHIAFHKGQESKNEGLN